MATVTVYGEGGYDPELPDGNVIETYEVDEPDTAAQDIPALVAALATLPPENLAALMQALGGTHE